MWLEKTEDFVIVYNLYMRNIPKHFTEELLKEYFSRFGEVSSLEIRFNEKKRIRYAFINYKEAESATAALQTKHHYIYGQWKVVTKADSWMQPNFEIKIDPDSLILMLNDDCLLHIFSFLSRRERKKLSQMNERFKLVFEYTDIRNKTVSILNLTLMEIRFICREFGYCIEKIEENWLALRGIRNLYRALDYITKYCCELRYLNLTNINIRKYTKFRLLKNLTKLSLRNCNISDIVCFHLSKLENLKYLDVSDNLEITGRYLKDFPEITHLNLRDCKNLKEDYLCAFFSSSRTIAKLKSLTIDWDIRTNTFVKLFSLENLENLAIRPSREYSLIPDIQGLKHLIIYTTDYLFNSYEKLTETNFVNLETLFIVGIDKFQLTTAEKNFIFSMKNIKKLGLIYCCNLSDEDMTKIATMPELTCLNVAKCTNFSIVGLLNLLEKNNKLRHVDVSENYLEIDTVGSNSQRKVEILKKLKEIKAKTHCTLYTCDTKITLADKDEYEECSSPLKQISERSVFPGMKMRYFPDYEFED